MSNTVYKNLDDASTEVSILGKYIPDNSEDIYLRILNENIFRLKIKNPRQTKYGDFRPQYNNNPTTITINNNLCKAQFHLTFLHEIAHLIVWDKYKNKVKPHGQEWFYEFKILLKESLERNIFSKQVEHALIKCFFLKNTYNNNCIDIKKAINTEKPELILTIDKIPENTIFTLKNNKQFLKEKKRRVKYLCTEIKTNKKYLVHELAEVLTFNKIINNTQNTTT